MVCVTLAIIFDVACDSKLIDVLDNLQVDKAWNLGAVERSKG
jgi:hypothetical protein